MLRVALTLPLLLLESACSPPSRGDPGGVPVTFVVELERAFVHAISEDVIVTGPGPGAEDGQEAHFGFGHGTWVSSTEVELRIGSRPGHGDVAIQELGWGTTRFTLPLRPGRAVALSVHVFGGRRGAHRLAEFQVPTDDPAPRVQLDLTRRALDPGLPAAASP